MSSSPGESERRSSTMRFETFTEAVPLALSSMAHASVPLENGVLDGITQVLQHTLLQCVNYARMMHPPHQWTFRDLCTSQFCWTPTKETKFNPKQDLSLPLSKMQFQHLYSRNALIYLKPSLPDLDSAEKEIALLSEWTQHSGILGRISLLYLSTEPLTKGEMDGTEMDDDMPPCILYKVMVEYRSLPPTGNQQAMQAEQLSMLSFGGSVDDDVKYGALASLYDQHAKYVLEIYSVRGKKYKFDLMDSTLSDGTIPRLPASREGDPFVKSLCATVTEHQNYENHLMKNYNNGSSNNKKVEEEVMNNDTEDSKLSETGVDKSDAKTKFAVSRINLILEGKPRKGRDFSSLPAFDYITNGIKSSFLLLNPDPPEMVTAIPSGHALLLDPNLAGRIYVNGRYVTTWGDDSRIGSHGVALFGMDLHSIPFWHGRIVDYEALKLAYAVLWHEILVDASLFQLGIATKLLYRLMTGKDRDEEEELYDDDEFHGSEEGKIDVNVDCLESQVLSSPTYDRVGIAPKALATKFAVEFGKDAFPCYPHEVEWVRTMLPDRKPVVTPQRLINILRRGGYFDTQRTADEFWFTGARPPDKGPEKDLVNEALQLLEQAGCDDVAVEQITLTAAPVGSDFVVKKTVVRYNTPEQTYCVHEKFFDLAVNEYIDNENKASMDAAKVKAYLLGMYIAKEHPDGRVLPRYLLRAKMDS